MVNFYVQKFDGHLVQGRICLSTPPSTIATTSSSVSKIFFMHAKEILEMECQDNKWHIRRCQSIAQCFTLHAYTQVKRTMRVCKSSKSSTLAPTCMGDKEASFFGSDKKITKH
jgi:hypothetical protein